MHVEDLHVLIDRQGQCRKSERDCLYAQDLPPELSHHSSRGSWSAEDAVSQHDLTSPIPSASSRRTYSGKSSSATAQYAPYAVSPSVKDSQRPAPQQHTAQLSYPLSPVTTRAGYSHFPITDKTHSIQQSPQQTQTELAISPVTQATSITPGQAPYEWWDQLAQDAIKDEKNYLALKESHSRWSFEPVDLSRSTAPSPSPFLHNNGKQEQAPQVARPIPARGSGSSIGADHDNVGKEPWNTTDPPTLSKRELEYLKYYIDNVGPIFDLFDPARTFTEVIPHLAMRNVGLLKSVLAVAARFRSLHVQAGTNSTEHQRSPELGAEALENDDFVSTQLYFDTLSYLAQAMQYPSYTRSQEILATAALISAYEYFHVNRFADWERHLKGVFWIQRSQETNGERKGVPGAVWWAWLRQDIWAALWQNRKPLTIWEPTIPVRELTGHEFASRTTFLLAKAIKYATQEDRDSADLSQRVYEGGRFLQDLQDWYEQLPHTYRPLPIAPSDINTPTGVFPPIWIHPPFHAAAMQYYYSAKILVLIHRPSAGGVNAHYDKEKMLNEAVSMICGLAQSPTAQDYPSAMVHFQALYVAGRCVRTSEQQKALYDIFDRVLEVAKVPTKTLLAELQKIWST